MPAQGAHTPDSFVLRGGTIVDGTGAPAFRGDVVVRDGRITDVGTVDAVGADGLAEIDVTGLVVAPGFIDIHTHYDAQILWDADLTPSPWHGVTTVVTGNCGFSIAPVHPDGRDAIIGTLENVEDMEPSALRAGIRWEFESFPEYLDLLERVPKRLNVAAMIGHSAVRLFAMGEDALDRAATPNEVQRMQHVVRDALAAGAVGFATSRSGSHIGHRAKPVASRVAEISELLAIVDAVEASGRGVVQLAAGSGLDEVAQIAQHTSRPVTWSALLTGRYLPKTGPDMVEATAELPGTVLPQISCRPLVLQLNLREPRGFASLRSFAEVLALSIADRPALYRDQRWRDRARNEMDTRFGNKWASTIVDESPAHPEFEEHSVLDLAQRAGKHPFDVVVDLALADDLATRFTFTLMNDDEVELGELLRDQRTILGLSDAGAHASQLCDACFSTHLLGHWVRDRQALPLELAVWRLTSQPAAVFGFSDRGRLRPGTVADIVAFDPDTVAPGRRERRNDLPGGAERLVVHALGVEHVWVRGQPILEHRGLVDGATPGSVLRPPGGAIAGDSQ